MKRMLVGFIALALLMVVECSAGGNKSTTTGTTFYVFCTFDSGYSTIDSVITIDTNNGSVLSADLVLYDSIGEVAAFWYTPTVTKNVDGDTVITVYGEDYLAGDPAWIILTLPVKSLKKYAGGNVVASGFSYWGNGQYIDYLATGTISP